MNLIQIIFNSFLTGLSGRDGACQAPRYLMLLNNPVFSISVNLLELEEGGGRREGEDEKVTGEGQGAGNDGRRL